MYAQMLFAEVLNPSSMKEAINWQGKSSEWEKLYAQAVQQQ